MDGIEKQFVQVGDIQLHVITAGPDNGEPVILLHGFPEFWYGWRHQIPFLADNGYRVIVPDQRGYNLSDKPDGTQNYSLDILAQDVANLIDAFGYETVHLVGHDWGGAIAWAVGAAYPEKLDKLVVLNCPSAGIFGDHLRNGGWEQRFRSLYMGFFQFPVIPEVFLAFDNYQKFGDTVRNMASDGAFTEEDMALYHRAWSQPDAMTSMLNYYRAGALHSPGALNQKQRITVPSLLLWGEQDSALSRELARPTIDLCDDGELVYFPDATHFIQHDKPDSVNEEILAFLAKPVAEVAT